MIRVFDQREWLDDIDILVDQRYWHITDFLVDNKQCFACKKKLPKDYEYRYCCDGFQCGCYGEPTDPGHCDNEVCMELAFNSNYREYGHMWE